MISAANRQTTVLSHIRQQQPPQRLRLRASGRTEKRQSQRSEELSCPPGTSPQFSSSSAYISSKAASRER